MIDDIRQAVELIGNAEEAFPVDRWTADGLHFWPIVRFQAYFALRNQLITRLHPTGEKRLTKVSRLAGEAQRNYLRYLSSRLRDARSEARPRGPVDAVFLGDQVSRVLVDGRWYDRLCDPLADALLERGRTCFQLDPNHEYRVPRFRPSMYIRPHLEWAWIRHRLTQRSAFRDLALDRLEEALTFFRREGLGDAAPTVESILRETLMVKVFSRFFAGILEVLRPAVAFVVEYDNPKGMALNLACRRQGVTTVEIPHGYHGELNIGYGRWNRVPEEGYELLPNVFWCWSEAEASILRSWCERSGSSHRVAVGGNPWLDRWLRGGDDTVARYDRILRDLKERNPGEIHILVTYEEGLPKVFDLVRESPPSWRWWLRLHPCRLQEREEVRAVLRERRLDNVLLDAPTDLPLYALLRHADVHLTEWSSVLLEAEPFGVSSVMTHPGADLAFSAQLATGTVVQALANEDIRRAIESQAGRKGEHRSPAAGKRAPLDAVLDGLLAGTSNRGAGDSRA
jgi:hypothetical protein